MGATVDLRLAKAKQEPTEALAKPRQKYHGSMEVEGISLLWGINVAINLKLRFKHTTNNCEIIWKRCFKMFQPCFCRLVSVSWMFSSKLLAESMLKTIAEVNLWRSFGWKQFVHEPQVVITSNLDQLTDHACINATAWNAELPWEIYAKYLATFAQSNKKKTRQSHAIAIKKVACWISWNDKKRPLYPTHLKTRSSKCGSWKPPAPSACLRNCMAATWVDEV